MGNLASAVDELLGTDVQQLDDATLIAELVDISREIQRLHAARLERVGVLDARGLGSASPAGSTAGWLRATTRMTPRAASRYVHLARDLVALPAVRSALAAGRLDLDHARVIASLRRDLNADAVAAPSRTWSMRPVGSPPSSCAASSSTSGIPTPPTGWSAPSRSSTPSGRCRPRPRSTGWGSGAGVCHPSRTRR